MKENVLYRGKRKCINYGYDIMEKVETFDSEKMPIQEL